MKITATIKSVKDTPKEYAGDRGTVYYIDGEFQEGVFSLGVKDRGKADQTIETLKGFIGKPEEYEVEEKGEFNGRPKYKLLGYPGKPAYGGGGFGGGGKAPYVPRYRDSEQGAKEERDSIARSVALQQAVEYMNNSQGQFDVAAVLGASEQFYQWLVKNNKPVSQTFDPGPQRATPASPNQVQAQANQASKMVEKANTLFNEPEPPRSSGSYKEMACPNCGESKHVRKSKLDGTPPWYCFKKLGGCGHQWGEFSPLTNDQPAEPRSPAVIASEEVAKAVRTKNMDHLMAVAKRIVERAEEKVFTQDELDNLDIEVTTAKAAIASGMSYDDWHRKALEAVQNRDRQPEMQDLAARF